jgi:ATP-dependent helicase/nuclease subunit B
MSGTAPPPSPAQAARVRPNLFTIPAGVPFLPTLAAAILGGRLDLGDVFGTPEALARLTIYLPTRRAARALASELVRRSGRKAVILPRLVPLGDPGEAELQDILNPSSLSEAAGDARLPIHPLTRRMLLARQILAASQFRDAELLAEGVGGGGMAASSLGTAFALAQDLASLLDAMQAEGVPYAALLGLDTARFDELWQLTARFLAILGEHWPQVLNERGEVDPITWRNRLLQDQADRLEAGSTSDPVIVAGSTGSMPATARLMAAVASRPAGAVVLPDLDLAMADQRWQALMALATRAPDRFASHPQAQLLKLLGQMRAARSDVRALMPEPLPPALLSGTIRGRLAHEALCPADAAEDWQTLHQRLDPAALAAAFGHVTIMAVADERLEALAIALSIKKALATPDRTIALVTPDRALAERVVLELGRWRIAVADSAGQSLARTEAGQALALLLDVAVSRGSADSLLALLHHPRLRLGLAAAEMSRIRQALEIGALRGARRFAGLEGLRRAVAAMPDRRADLRAPIPRQRLSDRDLDDVAAMVDRLTDVLDALLDPRTPATGDLGGAVRLLGSALDHLSRTGGGESAIFAGADGQALQAMLEDIAGASAGLSGTMADLARICRSVMAERVIQPDPGGHPRVKILGSLEARLMSPDLVILGGLNEGTWPPNAMTDPFLNRAMRAEIGLSSPERRIGQGAHDFIQAFSAPEVILTRAVKVGATQALPSRFWQVLKAVVPPALWDEADRRGAEIGAIAEQIDQPAQIAPARRPRPMPERSLQPTSYSVTDVETLYRDPYAVHARRILKLDPLEPLQVDISAADRGMLLHAVMERFASAWPAGLPDDPGRKLIDIGTEVFAELSDEPDVQAFWWPRFVDLVPAIVGWEAARRGALLRIGTEVRIAAPIMLADGSEVRLTARADRVEELRDGRLAIIDFKSGAAPSKDQIGAGLAPQLLLEAALGPLGRFVSIRDRDQPSIGPAAVASAAYVTLRAGDGLKQAEVVEPDELAVRANENLEGFRSMILGFLDGQRPFISRFAPQFMRFEGEYDHLARVKEWSAAADDDGEDGA